MKWKLLNLRSSVSGLYLDVKWVIQIFERAFVLDIRAHRNDLFHPKALKCLQKRSWTQIFQKKFYALKVFVTKDAVIEMNLKKQCMSSK